MYVQPLFAPPSRDALRALMRTHALATVLVAGDDGIESHLLPLETVDPVGDEPFGRLRGHLSRRHPMLSQCREGTRVTAVFKGPDAYLSPRWFVSGQRSGRLAPSWNYVAVEARGTLRWVDDGAWVIAHLAALTDAQESGRERPWSLDEANPGFVADLARQLIGFEVTLDRLDGKHFLSQQRTAADRESIARHLRNDPRGMARDVAALLAPTGDDEAAPPPSEG